MSTLLSYEATTKPFPLETNLSHGLPEVTQMVIVATNNSGGDVTLKGVQIQIPVGDAATDLTGDSTKIEAIQPEGWQTPTTKSGDNLITFIFRPKQDSGPVPKHGSLDFIFNNIIVNNVTGMVRLVVKEGDPDIDTTTDIYLTKFPHGWGEVKFWSEPDIIPIDGNVVLHWEGPEGATYTIEYYTPETGIVTIPAQGEKPLARVGVYPATGDPPLRLNQTTAFNLKVAAQISGVEYTARLQEVVTVENPLPKVISFNIIPLPLQQQKPVTFRLEWEIVHAGSFQITAHGTDGQPVAIGNIPVDATSFDVQPDSTITTYRLTAYPKI